MNDQAVKKKIAVILSRFPYPLDKGDKLRAYHQLKYLSAYYDITLFCLHTAPVSPQDHKMLEPFCREILLYKISRFDILKGLAFSLIKSYPVQVGYFFSKRIRKQIHNAFSSRNFDLVFCQLSRTALYTHDLALPKVMDFQDAFSTNYRRLAETSSGIYRLFYQREYHTMKTFEQKMLNWFTKTCIISTFDQQQISRAGHEIAVVPNGVDHDYFTPVAQPRKYDLLFIGNLSYLPNKNAVFYLVTQVLPLVIKLKPSIRINIAGADTPPEIFKLADENIFVSGFVPDIRDVYNSARIFVAPLFTGAGLQNKILEAMSMKLPCVTTSVVNSSLNATDNQEILIANDAGAFAEQILNVLNNEPLHAQLSANARTFVEENYSWQKANEKLRALL